MTINGERHFLWLAVDHEDEVLRNFVTRTADKKSALEFLRKSMKSLEADRWLNDEFESV